MLSVGTSETPSAVPNPKGSRRLRTVEGETDRESEEVAAGETEKNESDGKRKVGRGKKEEGRAGGIAWILIPTYPAIKLMNLIRPD